MPWSPGRARAFVMPYGKYRNHRLGDLIETADGLSYVRWLATRDAGNASIAARVLTRNESA
jgi:hypothetical protein